MAVQLRSEEQLLRESLDIPPDAERVLIFAESSHWDPNWLYTSEEYYQRFVEGNLDQAIGALLREARRVYSIECMFFLRMYWDRRPDRREQVRKLINQRRLRLTSSGVTTADTLIPGPEAILRDFLLGQEWLRRNGMEQEPKLAYFSDSFGSSPGLPSLLNASGFTKSAITRIDGMYFLGFERNHPDKYPRRGSSAELLLKEERTLDFIWRDRSGGEVLTHWNAFTYGQGDLLAHRGLSRIYVFPVAVPARSARHVAHRIRQFTSQLMPYSMTPYLLCPIGFDFVPPIPDLVALLDRYNRETYPETGIWAINAGLDDYLDLVACHRERLPVIELDPNPYWTGFYTSRPALKKRCHQLVEMLGLAESLALRPENASILARFDRELASTWWEAVVSNHHDFITGTSPDRVVYAEQIPWLEAAQSSAAEAVRRLAPGVLPAPRPAMCHDSPRWSRANGRIEILTPHFRLELDEARGGAIVRAEDVETGEPLLGGLGNDVVRYRVTGGLWRMGYEFDGGRWKQSGCTSDRAVELALKERDDGLELVWPGAFDGEIVERSMWLGADSARIYFRLLGRAHRRRTIVVRFETGLDAQEMHMDNPGVVVSRPLEKIYSPTFWPFQHFAHVRDRNTGRGLALYQRWPGAISFSPDGVLQVVALRNAVIERAYSFFPVSGNPAGGYEKEFFSFEYALEFTSRGDWEENNLPAKAYVDSRWAWDNGRAAPLQQMADSQVILSREDVFLLAHKPASRGPGRIVRLYTHAAQRAPLTLALKGRRVETAFLCDARERDIHPLRVTNGAAELRMPGGLATVRLTV
jgi:hypothetical protein